jgi:hypothetical protein
MLLSDNHGGEITFTIDTPQEAGRYLTIGIVLSGQKHNVIAYTSLRADDLSSNCSVLGHLERNWTATKLCRICSEGHCTDQLSNIRI